MEQCRISGNVRFWGNSLQSLLCLYQKEKCVCWGLSCKINDGPKSSLGNCKYISSETLLIHTQVADIDGKRWRKWRNTPNKNTEPKNGNEFSRVFFFFFILFHRSIEPLSQLEGKLNLYVKWFFLFSCSFFPTCSIFGQESYGGYTCVCVCCVNVSRIHLYLPSSDSHSVWHLAWCFRSKDSLFFFFFHSI